MTKKIITTILLVLISIPLVFGGIHRTRAVYGLSSLPSSNQNVIGDNQSIINNEALTTYMAIAETVQDELWGFRLDDGKVLEVEGRALTYMSSSGFVITKDQQVSLEVFTDSYGTLEISQITNLDSGISIILRGLDGRPVWGKGGGDH